MSFNFLTDENIKKQMAQGLSQEEAYELCYLISLNIEIRLSKKEKERMEELIAKKGGE